MIFLIRHGHVKTGDERKRFIGQTDYPLSEKGIKQAETLCQIFAPIPFSRIFSSDLQRSYQTALYIAKERQINVEPLAALREIYLGKWESMTFDDVKKQYPEEYRRRGTDIAGYRPPDAESFHDLQQRILPVFYNLINGIDGNILIIGHAGINRVIICHLLGMPLENLFCIGQDYGAINIIEIYDNTFRVKSMNVMN